MFLPHKLLRLRCLLFTCPTRYVPYIPLCPGKLAFLDNVTWLPWPLAFIHIWPLPSLRSDQIVGRASGLCSCWTAGSGSPYISQHQLLPGGLFPSAPAFMGLLHSTDTPAFSAPSGPGTLMASHCSYHPEPPHPSFVPITTFNKHKHKHNHSPLYEILHIITWLP